MKAIRTYAVVSSDIWYGEIGQKMSGNWKLQGLALYLLTHGHANMTGISRLPAAYISFDLGHPAEEIEEALQTFESWGFIRRDLKQGLVWVVEMASYELPDTLKPLDKRVKGLKQVLRNLPPSPLRRAFVERYGKAFHLLELLDEFPRPAASSEGASTGLADPHPLPHGSQGQGQGQDQGQIQRQGHIQDSGNQNQNQPESPPESAGGLHDPPECLSPRQQIVVAFQELGIDPPKDENGKDCIHIMLKLAGKDPKVVVAALRELGVKGCLSGLESIYQTIHRIAWESSKESEGS
ncbi:MAG: hypothetical protein SX243_12290 [Acidobacteriota bacterium]|nr:hypothetical protein [Acidobacteriota bacterium]